MSAQDLKQNQQPAFPLGAKGAHFHASNSRVFRATRWTIIAFIMLILSAYVSAHRLRSNIQQQTKFLQSELVIEMHEFSQLQRETLRLSRLLITEQPSSSEKLALHIDLVQSRITIVQKGLDKHQSNSDRNNSSTASIQKVFKDWTAIKMALLQLKKEPPDPRLQQDIIAQLEKLETNINRISLFNNQQHWEEYQVLIESQSNALNLLLLLITSFFLFAALFFLYAIRFAKTREQLLTNMEQISITDELTQIANRRHFNQTLTLEWNRMMREQNYIAILLCDIDYFKRYNDGYGHQAGDQCLREIAQALVTVTHRAGELAARYGGEEFVIILPNTSLEAARRAATKLHSQIEQAAIAHQHSSVSNYVTMSIGITIGIPRPNISTDYVLKQADEALYQAKRNGRNQSSLTVFNDKKLKEWFGKSR